jgi:long-chain acyl-CoA synthetase
VKSLAEFAQRYMDLGSETAFVYRRDGNTLKCSYGKVAELAFRFARELEARNIGKGERVMIWGDNCPEWVAVFLGCMLRGAVAVPMDKIAAPDFARRVTSDVEAKLVVCSAALAVHAGGRSHLALESMYDALAQRPGAPYTAEALRRDDTAQIVFTSGTTAEPRGVVLTHGNLLASVDPIEREIPKYRKYERVFHPIRFANMLPLSHVFGQFLGMFIPPLIGGTVIFQDTLKPNEVIAGFKRQRISVLVAVPRVIESVRRKIEHDFPGLEQEFPLAEGQHFLMRWWRFRRVHRHLGWKFWALISGGAALDQDTEEFWRRLGYVVIQGYGLTETSSLISLNHPFKVGRRSIGKVLPGREMKLDPESGEILVRGANVARQYWQGKEMKPVTSAEGWFSTGDLGAVDEAGNLYFKGRSKNVIVTPAGLKIYPEDLEQALRKQPEVRDCVVFPLARGGNSEACAVLLMDNGASAKASVASANQLLAEFQRIRSWLVWPDEDFPRTSTQKPKMNLIRETAEAQISLNGRSNDAGQSVAKDSPAGIAADSTSADLAETAPQSGTVASDSKYPYSRWAQRWPVRWIRSFIFHAVTWPYLMIMARPKVIGREKLKGVSGPVIIACNHISKIDIGFIMAALPMRLRNRVAPAMSGEMLRAMRHPPKQLPFFGRWLDQLNYVLITALFNVFSLPQRARYRESFQFAAELAARGYSVLIFPEGKRTETGEINEFRSGVGRLATRLNLPVVPMRIDGLFPLKAQKKHYARPGSVQVYMGEPVSFAREEDPQKIAQRLQQIVSEL